MSVTFLSLSKGLGETWKKLGKAPKMVVLSAALIAFAGSMVLLVTNARGPKYETLWSNLDPADAGAIVSELERESTPYRLEDGGRTIKIPAGQVYRTRLSLASQGLPSSGIVGFESIGSNGIWATDFERRVQYIRALSGELTRTVKSISAVEDARVHIVLPEPSAFASQRCPATAAVLLRLRPMQELSSASVRGIMNLVARSVEGLSPTEVAVMDSQGRLLSDEYGDSLDMGNQTAAFDMTSKVEKELEKRLVSLLTPVMGPGNVVCQVKADIDLDQVRVSDTSPVTEPEGILRSTEEIKETYKGAGAPVGQAGGLDVPSYGTSGSGDSAFERTEITRNYEVGQRTVETVVTPGAVKSLSVALLVNKELDEDSKSMLTGTVAAALGLDLSGSDRISVTGVRFDRSIADSIDGSLVEPVPTLNRTYVYAVAVGLALLLGTAFLAIMSRKRKNRQEDAPYPVSPMLPPTPMVSPEALQRQKAKESVENLARSNPRSVASLLKTWILEDEQ